MKLGAKLAVAFCLMAGAYDAALIIDNVNSKELGQALASLVLGFFMFYVGVDIFDNQKSA